MSGFYKKAVVWLGLNEEYADGETMDPHDEGESSMPRGEAPSDRGPGPGVGVSESAGGPSGAPESRAPRPRPALQSDRRQPEAESRSSNPLRANASYDRSEGTVRAVPMETEDDGSTPATTGAAKGRVQEPSTGTVRAVPMAQTTKPQIVVPKSFNNAQDVADMFRDKQPVIVNMQSAERDLARRLIDFSSGLCYGLGGQMEKVAKDVYLLTPTDVEVAAADRDAF